MLLTGIKLNKLVRRVGLVLSLAVLLIVSGCTGLPGTTGADAPSSLPVAPVREIVLANVKSVEAEPLWRTESSGPALVSAANGRVSVLEVYGTNGNPRVYLVDSEGKPLWTRGLESSVAQGGWARLTGSRGDLAIFSPLPVSRGRFSLLDVWGQTVFTKEVTGPVEALAGPGEEVLALLDRGAATLSLVKRDGTSTATFAVAEKAGMQFTDDGRLLVQDREKVFLTKAAGQVLWRYNVDNSLRRSVAISGDGRHIAVTTGQSDQMLYMFSGEGRLDWKQVLRPGGENKILFSPDSGAVAVYQVGEKAGINLFRTDTGESRFKVEFVAQAERTLEATSVVFSGTDGLLVDIAEKWWSGNGTGESHQLVRLSASGQPEWRLPLGEGAKVQLLAGGKLALVQQPGAQVGPGGVPRTRLTLFKVEQPPGS